MEGKYWNGSERQGVRFWKLTGSGQSPVVDYCERRNEPLNAIKAGIS